MATITYNGITLTYLSTRSIEFEPVKSEDQMDTLYTKITFDVTGIISPPIGPSSGVETATDTLSRIQHLLQAQRMPFQYAVGNQALVTWAGGPDARNGPHPKVVRVRQVVNTEVYHVDFQIELNINTCTADPRVPYVSHRWTEEVTIDGTARTIKNRRGRIITRGDMLTSPDALRGLVMTPIDQGFLRKESRYTLQSDGLALDYSYRDEEQYVMPPAPAWTAKGTYIESTPNGAVRYGEVRLTLRGSKQTDKGELLKTAILVATSKLHRDIFRDDKGTSITIGGVEEDMYEPEVSVTVKAMLKPFAGRVGRLPMDLARFTDFPLGSQPGQNPDTLPDPGTRGTAGLQLVAAALNDPCLSQTVGLRTGGSEPSGVSILTGQGAPPLATVQLTAVLPTDQAGLYSRDSDPGVFTHYTIHIRTIQDRHLIQMPVCKKGERPKVIQTAESSQKRIIRWAAEKIGDPPALPDPDCGPNFILARATIDTEQVEPAGDGINLKYRVAGRYVYYVDDFQQAVLHSGRPPWVDQSALSDTLKAVTKFVKGIIDLGLLGIGGKWTPAGKIIQGQTGPQG